jgi:HD superfamily phosphodiesterase
MLLLRTAVLYHDAGFILDYNNNEDYAISFAKEALPTFGYSEEQITLICGIINATKSTVEPQTNLEKIMCDADHDYLGRVDYRVISSRLRNELEVMSNLSMTDIEWVEFQLKYLTNKHQYYTDTANNIRKNGKNMRIQELNNLLKQLQQ